MPLRNMMQNLLNVMPDLKHSVETLPQKKGTRIQVTALS